MMLDNLKHFCIGLLLHGNPRLPGATQLDTSGNQIKTDPISESTQIAGHVIVGEGGRVGVTATDYCLAEPVNDSVQFIHDECVDGVIQGKHTRTYVGVFKNKSNRALKISELGVVTGIVYHADTWEHIQEYLIARECIPETLVHPNETFTVSLRLEV